MASEENHFFSTIQVLFLDQFETTNVRLTYFIRESIPELYESAGIHMSSVANESAIGIGNL